LTTNLQCPTENTQTALSLVKENTELQA